MSPDPYHLPHAAVDDRLTHDQTYHDDLARRLRQKNQPVLGKPFLVKRFERECDGRCGGTIVLITDGSRWAYALTVDPTDGYHAQDNLVDLDVQNAVAAVGCQAIHYQSEETCDGGFEVSIDTLTALPWQADEMTRWLEDVRR